MKLYAITHGQKAPGSNPTLTEAGKSEIAALRQKVADVKPTSVIIGTGKRFMETFHEICRAMPHIGHDEVKVSPILGSADSGKKGESGWDVILADGTHIKAGHYIGLIELQKSVDWPQVLETMAEEGCLLVTGREFVGALMGSSDKAKSATVYAIDTETGAITEI